MSAEDQSSSLGNLGILPQCVQLHILSFLSSTDASRAMCTNRQLCWLLLELCRTLSPQIALESTACLKKRVKENEKGKTKPTATSCGKVLKAAFAKLHARPNLAIIFCEAQIEETHSVFNAVSSILPPDITVLGAVCEDVVCNLEQKKTHDTDCGVFLASLGKDVVVEPFAIKDTDGNENPDVQIEAQVHNLLAELDSQIPEAEDEDKFWKAFIIVGGASPYGFEAVHRVLPKLQQKYPDATIIGGIAREGFVFSSKISLSSVEDGISGLALGGNVPMRSCVTRGVQSISDIAGPLTVKASTFIPTGAEYNMITSVSPEVSPLEWYVKCINQASVSNSSDDFDDNENSPHFVGIRRKGENGFLLQPLNQHTFNGTKIRMVAEQGDYDNCLVDSEIKLFRLTKKAIRNDLDDMLDRLKKEIEANNEEILATLMFSCNGRGPNLPRTTRYDFVDEEQMDASHFASSFPTIPLLGFYAAGEIGPTARGEVETVASQSGSVSFQGFTAVFGIFLKPKLSLSISTKYQDVVGSPSRLQEYFENFSSKRGIVMKDVI